MKTKIFTLFILLFALLSFGQNSSVNTSSKVAIKSNFSFQAIKVYQESAIFKVKDYYKFLEIYSSSQSSDSLKIELKSSIQRLFLHKNEEVVDFVSAEKKSIALHKLLDKIENKDFSFKLSEIENSIVGQDFWTTKYNLEVFETNQRCSIEVFSKILFKPVEKKFGSKTKEVWTLFLGEME
jgi:hypothetical protein